MPSNWPSSLEPLATIEKATTQLKAETLARSGIKKVRVLSESRFLELLRHMVEASVEKRLQASAESAAQVEDCEGIDPRLLLLDLAGGSSEEDLRSSYEKKLSSLRAELEDRDKVHEFDNQLTADKLKNLNRTLCERDERIARLQREVEVKNDEIHQLTTVEDDLVDKLVARVNERLDNLARPSEIDEIKQSITGLNRHLADIASVKATMRKAEETENIALVKLASKVEDVEIESNVSKVKVEPKRSRDVAKSLAKMAEMRGERPSPRNN